MSAKRIRIGSEKMIESAIQLIAESTSNLQQNPDGEAWRWPWSVIGIQLGCQGVIVHKLRAEGALMLYPSNGRKAGKKSRKKSKDTESGQLPSFRKLWKKVLRQWEASGRPIPNQYATAVIALVHLRDQFEHMKPGRPVDESFNDLVETCLLCLVLMEGLLRRHPVWASPEKRQEMLGLLDQAQDSLAAMRDRSTKLDLPPIPFPSGKTPD